MNQVSEFIISDLQITSLFSGNFEDIRLLASEINIFEDLFKPSVSGTLVISEATNLINNLPIYGNEILKIKFTSPEDANIYEKTFRVYKIEARKLDNIRSESYVLHFCSLENYVSDVNTVSKAYNKKLISDAADDIMRNYLFGQFQTLETTKYIHSFIIPNISPLEALNWLASRANSSVFNGANYLNYEDRDGWNFCSLELKFKQPPKLKFTQSIPNFLPPKSEPQSETKDPLDIRIIQDYRFETIADTLGNLADGMYASRLLVHSITEKKWRKYDFDYIETYPKMEHCEDKTVQNSVTSEGGSSRLGGTNLNQPNGYFKIFPVEFLKQPVNNAIDTSPRTIERLPTVDELEIEEFEESEKTTLTGKTKNVPRTTKTVRLSRIEEPPDEEIKRESINIPSQVWTNPTDVSSDLSFNSTERVERWMLQRKSQMLQINENIRLVMTVPGTVDITIGDMVEVDLQSPEPPQGKKVVPDVFYKGKYCVLALRHKITPDAFFTIVELGKDSVSAPYPDAA